MYCERCGAKNEDGARFCGECGAPLHEPQPYFGHEPGWGRAGSRSRKGSRIIGRNRSKGKRQAAR